MSGTAEDILREATQGMEKALEALQRSLGRVRTGRASLSLLDGMRVDYYGSPTPLNQVASLSIPEPRLITVQPWDRSAIPAIEKAILQSDMDFNPINDGSVIRIPIPKLTEERRKELVKVVKGIAEDSKVAVRNIRRDANTLLDKLLKDKAIPEDRLRKEKEEVQKLTDRHVTKIDEIFKKKEAEILEV